MDRIFRTVFESSPRKKLVIRAHLKEISHPVKKKCKISAMPTRTSRPKSAFFAKICKNRYLAPQRSNYFLSNKNSKKYNSSRSRRDIPETEELIQKFIDPAANGPVQNRDFFTRKCIEKRKFFAFYQSILINVPWNHQLSLVFTRFYLFSLLSILRHLYGKPPIPLPATLEHEVL